MNANDYAEINTTPACVIYRRKTYRVAAANFLGTHLYGLKSLNQDASIFPARKVDCRPAPWVSDRKPRDTTMNTPPNNTALDAFVARYAAIRGQLEQLQTLANDHFGFDPDTIHWGHVGTLTSVENQLTEILSTFEPNT